MTVLSNRSCNDELDEGGTDGKYKKVVFDRGGVVEDSTYRDRVALSDAFYGIHEAAVKILPDGTTHRTEDYRATAPVGIY
jgi:hypothetical protein